MSRDFFHKGLESQMTGHNNINRERRMEMGQQHQFKSGNKAPNNGVYIEIGETGSMVKDPLKIKLKAGDVFPDNSNHNRVWTYQRKP